MFFEDDFLPKNEEEGDNTPAWMLTFADLVSLLICFFVLLYSMKSVDEEIWKNISGSFAGALSSNQKFKQMNPNNNSGVDVERILRSDSMDYVESVITAKFEKEKLLQYSKIFQTENNSYLHIIVPAEHLFKDRTEELTEKGIKILTLISSCILYLDSELEIANYVKSDENSNTDMQNSLMRSFTVGKYFRSQGLDQPIKMVGFSSNMYEEMKDIYTEQDLNNKSVKLDIIIKTKLD